MTSSPHLAASAEGRGEVAGPGWKLIVVGCPPVGWGEGCLPSGGHFLNLSGGNASARSSPQTWEPGDLAAACSRPVPWEEALSSGSEGKADGEAAGWGS